MQEKRLESWDLAKEDVSAHFIIGMQGLVFAMPYHEGMDDFHTFLVEQQLKDSFIPSWIVAHEAVRQLQIIRSKRPRLRKLRKCQIRRIKRNEVKRHGR